MFVFISFIGKVGDKVSTTVDVTDADGNPFTGGLIRVSDENGNVLGNFAVQNGVADVEFTIANLPEGQHALTMEYVSDYYVGLTNVTLTVESTPTPTPTNIQ